ncbi:hypothetical protein ACPPVO_35760 [Dactylosporangium sp. McL0621]|uniref:hypothetical protein n=1 Tax=Dactylosporangium sp. McL0621 TaxID=3415678 RepID=UPI003CF9C710
MCTELDQAVRLRLLGRICRNPELIGRTPQQVDVAERLSGSQQQQRPSRGGEPAEPFAIEVLDPVRR